MHDEERGVRRFSRVEMVVDTKEKKRSFLNILTLPQLFVVIITVLFIAVVNRSFIIQLAQNYETPIVVLGATVTILPVLIVAYLIGFHHMKKYELTFLDYLIYVRPYKRKQYKTLMYFADVPEWYKKDHKIK